MAIDERLVHIWMYMGLVSSALAILSVVFAVSSWRSYRRGIKPDIYNLWAAVILVVCCSFSAASLLVPWAGLVLARGPALVGMLGIAVAVILSMRASRLKRAS